MTIMFGLNPQPHLLLLLLVVGLFSLSVQSLRFELKSGFSKCIAEDLKTYSMTVGNYSIVNPYEGHPLPDSHNITIRVFISFIIIQFFLDIDKC